MHGSLAGVPDNRTVSHALINDQPSWQPPDASSLDLQPGVIDLWRIRLGKTEPRRQTRIALDRILRRYLDLEPGHTPSLGRHPGGKPFLVDPPSTLEFNLSHSRGLAVIAVATSHPVGVDLEFQRPVADLLRIAGRVWSPRELEWLEAQPPALREAAFFVGWTRFEARQKTAGQGIFAPPADPRQLSERVFVPAEGYVACVAVADCVHPRFRHFDHTGA
jgi:phosphopantetheinyl transferase